MKRKLSSENFVRSKKRSESLLRYGPKKKVVAKDKTLTTTGLSNREHKGLGQAGQTQKRRAPKRGKTFEQIIVSRACTVTQDLVKARSWLDQAVQLPGTLSEAFLNHHDACTHDVRLYHVDSFPSRCGYAVRPAMLAPIWHRHQLVGMHATMINDDLSVWSYEHLGVYGVGVVCVRQRNPYKVIIAEQIQDALVAADLYDNDYTILAACNSYGLAAYNPPRHRDLDIVIVTTPDLDGQAAAAGLFNKVAAYGGRNKARIIDRMKGYCHDGQ